MNAHQQHVPVTATSQTPLSTSLLGADSAIARLADLVRGVVRHLETAPVHEPLHNAVAECNAELEVCLEAQRELRGRDASMVAASVAAKDELKRLARLLTTVDHADATMVMRQIRRVLGRFDTGRA